MSALDLRHWSHALAAAGLMLYLLIKLLLFISNGKVSYKLVRLGKLASLALVLMPVAEAMCRAMSNYLVLWLALFLLTLGLAMKYKSWWLR